MLAVISDIHANLEALEAVLADIATHHAGRILCLGDIVGYGPDPEACLTLVRERCALTLRGNHDLAVLEQPLGFNPAARRAAEWTRERLRPGFWSGGRKRANWKFLQNATLRHEEEGILFVHASPRDPVTEYIEESDTLDIGFGVGSKIQEILRLVTGLCCVGHTHRPGVIDGNFHFHRPAGLPEGWRRADTPAIVNVGSVGQPRDNDPRACYVTIDEERVIYRRVAYDFEKTAAKIRAVPALDPRLAERLATGT